VGDGWAMVHSHFSVELTWYRYCKKITINCLAETREHHLEKKKEQLVDEVKAKMAKNDKKGKRE
jgi:hypothetical protein